MEGHAPATLNDDTPPAPSQLVRMLCHSDISRVVFAARGTPLDASRFQRRFSVTQKRRLSPETGRSGTRGANVEWRCQRFTLRTSGIWKVQPSWAMPCCSVSIINMSTRNTSSSIMPVDSYSLEMAAESLETGGMKLAEVDQGLVSKERSGVCVGSGLEVSAGSSLEQWGLSSVPLGWTELAQLTAG